MRLRCWTAGGCPPVAQGWIVHGGPGLGSNPFPGENGHQRRQSPGVTESELWSHDTLFRNAWVVGSSQQCYVFNGRNHFTRDCLVCRQCETVSGEVRSGGGRSRRRGRCYQCGPECGNVSHIAFACPGNKTGEGTSAPASSPSGQ